MPGSGRFAEASVTSNGNHVLAREAISGESRKDRLRSLLRSSSSSRRNLQNFLFRFSGATATHFGPFVDEFVSLGTVNVREEPASREKNLLLEVLHIVQGLVPCLFER